MGETPHGCGKVWRTLLWLGAGVVALLIVTEALTFVRGFEDHSPFDYGPLQPVPAALPTSAPTSSVLADKFRVEYYAGSDHKPDVIASRRTDGSIIGAWQIGPVLVDGRALDDLMGRGPAGVTGSKRKEHGWVGWVVHGHIGDEHATFYFDQTGKLDQYWVSW